MSWPSGVSSSAVTVPIGANVASTVVAETSGSGAANSSSTVRTGATDGLGSTGWLGAALAIGTALWLPASAVGAATDAVTPGTVVWGGTLGVWLPQEAVANANATTVR